MIIHSFSTGCLLSCRYLLPLTGKNRLRLLYPRGVFSKQLQRELQLSALPAGLAASDPASLNGGPLNLLSFCIAFNYII